MKTRFLWIKLNTYSLLLCGLLTAAALLFFSLDCLHDALWKKIVFAVGAFYLLHKILFIMGQYQHKKEVMQRLITTCREQGYAPRRFMTYMDSLCMQRMVYLTLSELDMRDEFAKLKARKNAPAPARRSPARAIYEFKNGKLEFILIETDKTGEKE